MLLLLLQCLHRPPLGSSSSSDSHRAYSSRTIATAPTAAATVCPLTLVRPCLWVVAPLVPRRSPLDLAASCPRLSLLEEVVPRCVHRHSLALVSLPRPHRNLPAQTLGLRRRNPAKGVPCRLVCRLLEVAVVVVVVGSADLVKVRLARRRQRLDERLSCPRIVPLFCFPCCVGVCSGICSFYFLLVGWWNEGECFWQYSAVGRCTC